MTNGDLEFRVCAFSQKTVTHSDKNKFQALPCPEEVALSDFHACSIGRPGIDIAHFLLTSTTREFRWNDQIMPRGMGSCVEDVLGIPFSH